ncbi:winged helix-turn-helix transcriptional regulator [Patulibacter minatonensis]|uniref:winged helix-turn-helix transcriptional regulator n=1 Tax=Patulibacter minatonensis TaxID=298163 RepID=UPI0004ACD528|nr:helix-turn-helix domain-containing protein [Patulibacter minatonensis]
MLHRDYDTQVCSVARSLEVVGERWTLLLVRSVMLGVRRFDDLQSHTGVTRSVLTARLRRLVDEGVLERRPYQDRPPRFEYVLTEKGLGLWTVIEHLRQWGDEHYPEPEGPPRVIVHKRCGGHPDVHLMCDRCGEPLSAWSVKAIPGPALIARGLETPPEEPVETRNLAPDPA